MIDEKAYWPLAFAFAAFWVALAAVTIYAPPGPNRNETELACIKEGRVYRFGVCEVKPTP